MVDRPEPEDVISRAISQAGEDWYPIEPALELRAEANAALDVLLSERDRAQAEIEELNDRNRWRWPHKREARLKAETQRDRYREALEAAQNEIARMKVAGMCECGHAATEHRFKMDGGNGWCKVTSCNCDNFTQKSALAAADREPAETPKLSGVARREVEHLRATGRGDRADALLHVAAAGSEPAPPLEDPLEGANCTICGATADNFHVPDDLWATVGLGEAQACFKCFRIAAFHAGVSIGIPWDVRLGSQRMGVACVQALACGWRGRRLVSLVGVQPDPCPKCGKEVVA